MIYVHAWFEYVRTSANVSDEPSRADLSRQSYVLLASGTMVGGVGRRVAPARCTACGRAPLGGACRLLATACERPSSRSPGSSPTPPAGGPPGSEPSKPGVGAALEPSQVLKAKAAGGVGAAIEA